MRQVDIYIRLCSRSNGVRVSRYFLVDADGKVMSTQEGTFRSNCMDCLDRTNVIQSMLAQRSLQSQLRVRPFHPTPSETSCSSTRLYT